MKNIVVCCDGTGNEYGANNTNVVEMYSLAFNNDEQITFYDNNAFDDDDLKDAMEEISEDRWWRSADFDPEKYKEDKDLIVQFYKENGYRDAEIIRDSLYYSEDREDLFIDIWVYEGNKYHFGKITFSGNEIFTENELQATLDIEKGDIYDQKMNETE